MQFCSGNDGNYSERKVILERKPEKLERDVRWLTFKCLENSLFGQQVNWIQMVDGKGSCERRLSSF